MKWKKWAPKDKPTGQAGGKVSKAEQGLAGNERRIRCRKKMFLLFRANPSYSVLIREKGFTILEVMIALVILSMALLALLRVMPVGIRGSKMAEETTIATMLAQRKIEETKAGSWPPSTSSGDFATEGYPNFEYDIQSVDSVSPTIYVKEVTVTVSWPVGVSPQQTVALKTRLADYSK